MYEIEKQTLCWRCKKYGGGCSWSKNFIPVEGWEATPKLIKSECESFIVKNCPLFEDDKRYLIDLQREIAEETELLEYANKVIGAGVKRHKLSDKINARKKQAKKLYNIDL